jgi:NADPH:quinone reductase-like Zn-dependent oxidoreductase
MEKKFDVHGISFLVQPSRKQLGEISRLVDSGALKPLIQKTFSLKDAKNAYSLGSDGHNTGKIVLEVRK